jgi:hypothetical protein
MNRKMLAAAAAAAILALGGCSNDDDDRGENRAPVVDAGPDRAGALGQAVTLQASGTDPDGDDLLFRWNLSIRPRESTSALATSLGREAIFVPDVEGVYVVALYGFDGALESMPDLVTVRVGAGAGGETEVSAYAGADRAVAVGATATLDGTGSYAGDGLPLAYAWTLESRPAGSEVELAGASTATPTLVADVAGAYVVGLTVTARSGGTASDSVTLTASNLPPTADPGGDRDVYVGATVPLVANAEAPDGEPITYLWTLESRPEGSAAEIAGTSLAEAALVPDVAGWYLVSLVVSDAEGAAAPRTFTVRATPPLVALGHRVVDAAYAAAIDRLVTVAGDPSALYVIDPVTRAEARVLLPVAPTCVSVAPDGARAVVGHDAYLSVVDLAAGRVEATLPVPGTLGEVVLAAGGWAYAFSGPYSSDPAWAVELATGGVTTLPYFHPRPNRAALHPSGARLYGAESSYLLRLDLAGAAVTPSSRYEFDHSACGALWLAEDGSRIFTGCGAVFRTSDMAASDMSYNGRLTAPEQRFASVAHSAEAGLVLAVPEASSWSGTGDEDTLVRIYEDQYLAPRGSVEVSPFLLPTGTFAGHARAVFFSADGSRRYALVQADASSAALLDWAYVEL